MVAITCDQCGTQNLGTKFCETCGAPVVLQSNEQDRATAIQSVETPSATQPRAVSIGATPPRVVALVCFVLANTAPSLINYAVYSAGVSLPYLVRVLTVALISLAGLFILIAAASGRAPAAGKTFGAVFALVYVVLAVWLQFGGMLVLNGYANEILFALSTIALFVSWGLGRPFRGPGYFGLLVLIGVTVIRVLIQFIPNVLPNYAGYLALQGLIFGVSVWLTVGLSVAFEGKITPAAIVVTAPHELPLGEVNSRAQVAFVLAMSMVGIELFSLIASVIGLYFVAVISFAVPVLIVLTLVFGHLARSQIRSTHQKGAGRALVALIVGYALIALTVAGIVIPLLVTAAISTNYGE
jgi:hypothetical protein